MDRKSINVSKTQRGMKLIYIIDLYIYFTTDQVDLG